MSEQPQGASLAADSSPAQHIHSQSSFDAQPTHLSSSPEAGPSSPRSDIVHGPLELSTSRTSQAENDEVDKAIHAKRRKSSLLPGVTIHLPNPLHRKHGKRKDSIGGESHHQHEHEHDIHESPEALAADRTEGGAGGLEIPDIADHRETDEGRELEEELDRLLKEAEEARGHEKNHIAMLEGGRNKSRDPEEPSESELPDPGREYVWEVLFENQRGLYAFGKAYFSPGALLPADPSAYTLPIRTLPAASSKFIISNPDGENEVVHSSENKTSQPLRRRINTAYTRETFQLPSPDWEWVDEWSINMRTGTDEMGWRYNAWFKKKGWRSKAGTAGWWGWVRRREWVRLRRLMPGKSAEDEDTRVDDPEPRQKKNSTLRQIIGNKEDEEALLAIGKELKGVSLDREKLAIWERWLDDVDSDLRKRVQVFLDEPHSRKILYGHFMYRSTSDRFADLLVERGFSLPESAATISRTTSRSSSPTPQSGYELPA